MPENDFEKQVQQKMEVLKMVPSEAVWQKVQAQITTEKKRRRFILLPLLFLFCGLLLAYLFIDFKKLSIFTQHTSTNTKQPVSTQHPALLQHSSQTSQQNSLYPHTNNQAIISTNDFNTKKSKHPGVKGVSFKKQKVDLSSKNTNSKKIVKSLAIQKMSIQENTENKLIEANDKNLIKGNLNVSNGKSFSLKKRFTTPIKKVVTISTNAEEEEMQSVKNSNADDNRDIAKVNTTFDKKISNDKANGDTSFQNKIIAIKSNKGLDKDTNRVDRHIEKPGNKNKWGYSIVFTPGTSYTGSKYFTSNINTNYYVSSAFDNNSTASPTGQGVGSVGNLFVLPSTASNGLAFNIGFAASRKITQRLDFTAGLQYKYYSTSLLIGQQVPPTASSNTRSILYTRGNTNTYSNQYHFIEIPITLQSRLGKEKMHSFYGEIGFVCSQLFSTNSLQFSNQDGLYFSKNDFFNKTSIGITAGFSINVIKNKNAPLLLGPSFYYALTPMASSGLYAKSHYSFVGLRLQKYLKRN